MRIPASTMAVLLAMGATFETQIDQALPSPKLLLPELSGNRSHLAPNRKQKPNGPKAHKDRNKKGRP